MNNSRDRRRAVDKRPVVPKPCTEFAAFFRLQTAGNTRGMVLEQNLAMNIPYIQAESIAIRSDARNELHADSSRPDVLAA
ncbi:MAG: hypothetical protein ABI589_03445 [Burkholderiales bacterium]